MRNIDSVKFILKAKPKRNSGGHYFNGYFEVGGKLISITISVGENGQVVYTSEKGGGQDFIYATATNWGSAQNKTMSKGYSKGYNKKSI
jgi:hypothetical protein